MEKHVKINKDRYINAEDIWSLPKFSYTWYIVSWDQLSDQ